MIPSVSEEGGNWPDFRYRRRPRRTLTERGAATLDRLPPHDIQMEMGVLGCIMLSPRECLAECVVKIRTKEVFYDLRHQTIYEHLVAMFDANLPIDLITVQQRLKDAQVLEQIGGIPYLSQLQDSVPSAANLGYYMEIILEKAMLRNMVQTCTGVVGRVYEYEGDVDALVSEVERTILGIRDTYAPASSALVDIKLVQQRVLQQYENAHNGIHDFGIQTGFGNIDRIIGGLTAQEMIAIGGVPSAGKTSLMWNIVNNLAIISTTPVGIFSLDDPAETIIHRLNCINAEVDGAAIRRGECTEGDMVRLGQAVAKVHAARARLMIDDSGGLTDRLMLAKGRRMVQAGAKVLFLDYLQLLQAEGQGMYEKTTNASHAIKNMAKELRVPVVVISAITKPNNAPASWKPTMFDFRGSGDIDYDINQAWLLYRKPGDETNDFAPEYPVVMDIAKNKQGGTGTMEFIFRKPCTKFTPQTFSHE